MLVPLKKMFKGETTCQGVYKSGNKAGESCKLNAYFKQNGKYYCGRHSDKDKRSDMSTNPNIEIIKNFKIKEHSDSVEKEAIYNRENGVKGKVIVTKLKMWGSPEDVDGYLKVFPNFKHGNRKDGYGCASLSPKSIGPVEHIMPNLPIAQNLENFHQFSKIFPFEIEGDIEGDIDKGQIKDEILQMRIDAYNSKIPERHKYDAKELKKYGNVNVPSFSVYYDKDGNEYRYKYFECRYFYCKVYENMAKYLKEFLHLKDLIEKGYNLQIVGYDGYNVTKSLKSHYHDTSRPFGHELVLYTLLTVDDPKDYPWNIEYVENVEKYEGVGI